MTTINDKGNRRLLSPEQQLFFEVGFYAAIFKIKNQIKELNFKVSPPDRLTSIFGQHEYEKRTTKIHFNRIVSSFMKKYFPAFDKDEQNAEEIIFKKNNSPEKDINIVYKKNFQHWERAYEIEIGVNYVNSYELIPPSNAIRRMDFRVNLFELYSVLLRRPVLKFDDDDMLQEQLTTSYDNLKTAISLFEGLIAEYLPDQPTDFQRDIPRLGSLTAREGFLHAEAILKGLVSDYELVFLSNYDLPKTMDIIGPGIDYNGRLKANGYWGYCFRSLKDNTEIDIKVPCFGFISSQVYSGFFVSKNRLMVKPNWLDSDKAFDVMETACKGKEKRSDRSVFRIKASLDGWIKDESSRPYWRVEYLTWIPPHLARIDYQCTIDPYSGEMIGCERIR